MATLLDQLQRESEDLCGHRGLLAGTDEQTFSMALPAKLRNYYDKVVTPATSMGGGASAGPRSHKLTGTAVQQMVQAYGTMNKFLTRFLEHVSLVVNVTFFHEIPLSIFDFDSRLSRIWTLKCEIGSFWNLSWILSFRIPVSQKKRCFTRIPDTLSMPYFSMDMNSH